MDIVILPDAASLAVKAADIVEESISENGRLMLGLAGGSTPRSTHEQLASRSIDWSDVTAWIADERWVPPASEDANQQMVRESIVEAVDLAFLAPDTTAATPAVAAADYGDLVIPRLTDSRTSSMLMLGMGTDGHTASLFPGTTALGIDGASYVANFVPQLDTWRLTATFGMIELVDVVIFLVSGESKAEKIAEIAAGGEYPAARVRARDRVVWLLDEPAASLLA